MARRLALLAATLAVSVFVAPAFADRALGMDVADWQGNNINWATAAKPVASGGGGISFAFVRSSRGGTTGTYNESTTAGTLSARYDDLYFANNMAKAKTAGVLTGAYHFARPDVAGNTGLDEANHFLEIAGAYMRPGYIRPVLDLEAGSALSRTALTDWALAFSDRLLAVTGVRPIVYVNSSYATDEVDARINIHDLWLARPADTTVVNIQTVVDPPAASSYPNQYGVWNPTYPTIPAVRPWDFWQYATSGAIPGVGSGVDHDVANGDIEFVKDFLVPAMWNVNADGEWTTASNWNGVTTTPQPIDRVILSRSAGNYAINLSSGTQSIRSLQNNEILTIKGGNLNVSQYANLAALTTVSSGSLTAGSIVITSTLNLGGGTVTSPSITGTGAISAEGGLVKAGVINVNSLGAYGGQVQFTTSATSVVKQLTLVGANSLDLGTAKLIVDYSTTNPLEQIRQALQSGALVTTAPGTGYGVAALLSTDLSSSSFGGVAVDATAVLLSRALRGDADLSGTVNFDDLIRVAQNYNLSGRWSQGDFNYDGVVNFDDLIPLAQNYNQTVTSGGILAGDSASFASDWALAQALVPEPATALPALTLLALRRVRRASEQKLG